MKATTNSGRGITTCGISISKFRTRRQPRQTQRGKNQRHDTVTDSIYQPFSCTDASSLPSVLPRWNVEFSQLGAGDFTAVGSAVTLDRISIARFSVERTLQNLVSPPRGSTAILLPGAGSRGAFALGRQIALGQCVTVANGGRVDAITRDHYVSVALAVDDDVWNKHAHWLDPSPLASCHGARVENPGPTWIGRMEATVDWIYTALQTHPRAASRADVQVSIADQLLVALTDFGNPRCRRSLLARLARTPAHCGRARSRVHPGKAFRTVAAVRSVQSCADPGALARIWFSRDRRSLADCLRQAPASERRAQNPVAPLAARALDYRDRHGPGVLAPESVRCRLSQVVWRSAVSHAQASARRSPGELSYPPGVSGIASVSQTFDPSGRFFASNSKYPLRFTYHFCPPTGKK